MNGESIETKPLDQRVCLDLLVAGHVLAGGENPKCLGVDCSKYEQCLLGIHESINELWRLHKVQQGQEGVKDNASQKKH